MALILVLWLTLILAGISMNKDGQKPFCLKQTICLRGICAVEIMTGHIGLATGSVVLYPNRKAGILFVGIFFMLSGYGVAYGMEHKADYSKQFLLNRTIKLLIPAYAVKTIMLLTDNFLSGFTGGGIAVIRFLTELNWYVWEQLLFYFIYWVAKKILPAYVELSVGIFSALFILLAYVNGLDNPWYGSSLCFVLGLYYYRYEKRTCGKWILGGMSRFDSLKYYILLSVSIFITGIAIILFFTMGNDSFIGNPAARNTASVAFGIAVILLLYKVKIGNRASYLLGKCSYEIFLVHPYMIYILSKMAIQSEAALGILTIVLSVISAYLIHFLMEKVFGSARSENHIGS